MYFCVVLTGELSKEQGNQKKNVRLHPPWPAEEEEGSTHIYIPISIKQRDHHPIQSSRAEVGALGDRTSIHSYPSLFSSSSSLQIHEIHDSMLILLISSI